MRVQGFIVPLCHSYGDKGPERKDTQKADSYKICHQRAVLNDYIGTLPRSFPGASDLPTDLFNLPLSGLLKWPVRTVLPEISMKQI